MSEKMTTAAIPPQKTDPINKRYFKTVERADSTADGLFYLAAALSFARAKAAPLRRTPVACPS